MNIKLNGENHDCLAGVNDVAGLLASLGLDAVKVAVEKNREIVPRSLWAASAIADGDEIEIIHFVGGG